MLNKIREIVEKDKETKKLTVSDADLLLVYNYILERDGKTTTQIPKGYKLVLLTEPYLHTEILPTEEKMKEIEQSKHRDLIDTLGTDNYILDASIDDFYLSTDERKRAHIYAMRIIEARKNKKYIKGMFLTGQYRTGKSYLFSALAKELIKLGSTVLYVYFPDLVRTVKDSINDNSVEEKVSALKKCDYLFLDDMGAENMTPWFRDDIFGPILQFRLAAELPVFISTNYTKRELAELLATTKSGIDGKKAARLITRISELTEEFQLNEKVHK